MNGSVLNQFTSRTANAVPSDSEADGIDDLGNFGWLRGIRDRSLMLAVHKKDGSITAFGYAWLERVDFNPTEGITLKFANQTVKIVGRNLHMEVRPNVRLIEGLCRHRIPWIRESDRVSTATSAGKTPTVELIEW